MTSATILNAVRDGRSPIPAHRIGNGTSGLLFAKDDVVKQWPPLAGFIGQDQMADRAAAGLVSMDLDQKAAERRLVTP